MATRCSVWTGAKTNDALSAPHRYAHTRTALFSSLSTLSPYPPSILLSLVCFGHNPVHGAELPDSTYINYSSSSFLPSSLLSPLSSLLHSFSLSSVYQDGKVIVWDAFTTNKVSKSSRSVCECTNGSLIQSHGGAVLTRLIYVNVYAHCVLGTCSDHADYVGDGVCLRPLWLCHRLWVSLTLTSDL